MDGTIRIKIYGKFREVYVTDTIHCKNYKCFHPHDCPIQVAGEVRQTDERWMCLTNALHGCPDRVIRKDLEKVSDDYIKYTYEK